MKKILFSLCVFAVLQSFAQHNKTVFEQSNGTQTPTYAAIVSYYEQLASSFATIKIHLSDTTDAGYPLQVVLFSNDKTFDPAQWHAQQKAVILVLNGIHPGEPDGIDASMMLLRDLATGKLPMPGNVALAVIPVYNIGGCLNRSSYSRVNQDGPESYGFRGNSRNLDLNRDFIKADSREALAFEKIFQWINPDIFIDNHVSDGADYQHTMTLLTTQHNKLGGATGKFLHEVFEPALFRGMQQKNWPMTPYVNVEETSPDKGWTAFYDPPRYSSGYASLFQTMAFVPETHMLKPFKDRVQSTYALMQTFIENAAQYAPDIKTARKQSREQVQQQTTMALGWKPDTTQYDLVSFKGYAAAYKASAVTGQQRLYYDHTKPYEQQVMFRNTFIPTVSVEKPAAYIIPQGWHPVLTRLRINGVVMQQLQQDTTINVSYYTINSVKSMARPYENHHVNYDINLSARTAEIRFLKGDYIIYTGQAADRYIVETLEPLADDSFFKWNFFDGILQQKEWYSDYRWEDVAAAFLAQHPEVKQQLEAKKQSDINFAKSAHQQLEFVYKQSPYYEPSHNRYPVYRLMR